jgi:1,4-dihydroxy-2-naphthoyl-CoA synthase
MRAGKSVVGCGGSVFVVAGGRGAHGMIDYEVIGHIAYIRLNRPEKLNALTNAGISEYVAAIKARAGA